MKNPSSSVQITRAADYAVRVMVHLAAAPHGERMSLQQLAHAAQAPESFLSKVLQTLAQEGLILSRRGQAGGFAITWHGVRATMREVIEAVDGPMRLNVCLAPGKSCHRKSCCPAHPVWARAQRAMVEVLDSVTVAGLAGQSLSTRRGETCVICESIEAAR